MADRFYYPGIWENQIILADAEAQHLAKVLRKQVGDQVQLFDGRGSRAEAVVTKISKRDVHLELCSPPIFRKKGTATVTLAVAPPKGDRFRWLVEKATELGVERIIPIRCERSVVHPGETKLEKLGQTIISACKQSGRDDLLDISTPISLRSLPEDDASKGRVVYGAVPAPGDASYLNVNCLSDDSYDKLSVLAVIGPEGGFSDQEVAFLNNFDAIPCCLSPHVLRVETAAIAFASTLIVQRFSNFW